MSLLEALDQKATKQPLDANLVAQAKATAAARFRVIYADNPALIEEVLETPISLYPSTKHKAAGTGFMGTPLACVESLLRHTIVREYYDHRPRFQGQVMGVWLIKKQAPTVSAVAKAKDMHNVLGYTGEQQVKKVEDDPFMAALRDWHIASHVLEGTWGESDTVRRMWANTSLRVVYPDGFRVWCTVENNCGLFFSLKSRHWWGMYHEVSGSPPVFLPLSTDKAFKDFLSALMFTVLRYSAYSQSLSAKPVVNMTLNEMFSYAHRSVAGGVPNLTMLFDYIWREDGKRATIFEYQETARAFQEEGRTNELTDAQIESLSKRPSKPSDLKAWEAAKKRLEFQRKEKPTPVEDAITVLSQRRHKRQLLWSPHYEAKQKQSESEETTSPERPFVQRREPLWWNADSTD